MEVVGRDLLDAKTRGDSVDSPVPGRVPSWSVVVRSEVRRRRREVGARKCHATQKTKKTGVSGGCSRAWEGFDPSSVSRGLGSRS